MVLNENIISRFEEELKKRLLDSWTAQGHFMNGKIIETVELIVKSTKEYTDFQLWMAKYGAYLEAGVKKDKIPFSGITGRGGKSLYIEGLKKYVMKRMSLPEKKALSVAFAIAHTHKREGMPSKGSYAFSSTGKRTEWTQEVLKDEDFIGSFISELFDKEVEAVMQNIVLEKEVKLNLNVAI